MMLHELAAIPSRLNIRAAVIAVLGVILAGCTTGPQTTVPPMAAVTSPVDYIIGPGDSLEIFVWRNPDLSTKVPVRPDGKISIPLVEDIVCTGKTPTQLARDIEVRLKKYVNDPNVTVIVDSFVGSYGQQVRVVGEAAQPKAIPYKNHMTVLDAMIEVGGLTQYAAGNRATVVRNAAGHQSNFNVRLNDLLKDGDVGANIELAPGDIIIIPQSYF
jgi:polysaccharide export outer membrane protein